MSSLAQLANGLYPIIRRARRPLVEADDETGAPAPPPPKQASDEPAGEASHAKSGGANAATKQEKR
jgi:hypothetical protein